MKLKLMMDGENNTMVRREQAEDLIGISDAVALVEIDVPSWLRLTDLATLGSNGTGLDVKS